MTRRVARRASGRPLFHVLTDRASARGRPDAQIAAAALRGGADAIQLRDKSSDLESLRGAAAALRALTRTFGAQFVVNDSLELARAAGADGLHVGPDDLPVEAARLAWPRPLVLGASARTVEDARRLEEGGADYLGVGPVFGTTTKADAPPAIGLETLALVAAAVRIPVLAIGGVDASNAASTLRAGAAGVAVISAVVGAADPEAAALAIRRALDGEAASLLE